MISAEMLTTFTEICAEAYDKVSPPRYYHGSGPYLAAVGTDTTPLDVHLYAILDSTDFVANSTSLSPGFMDPDFVISSIAAVKIPRLGSGNNINLQFRQILADTPACRDAALKLAEASPRVFETIFFLTDDGSVFHAQALLDKATTVN